MWTSARRAGATGASSRGSVLPQGAATILGVALGLWLVVAVLTAMLLWNAKQSDIQDAKLHGAATTALLQAHTASTFAAVENALVDLARTVERERPPRHDAALQAEMDRRLAAMPYVRALFVIGPDGRIRHDTDHPRTPDVSLADRPYFRQYLENPALDTALSSPIMSRSGVGWFVAVTRRIGDGPEFRGVAVAALQLQHFSTLYRDVGLRDEGEILLFHREGHLLAQYPDTFGRVGESYAHLPLFREHLPRASWGAILVDDSTVSYPRVVNYAALFVAPLVVGLVQNMERPLAAWRMAAAASGLGLAVLLGAILLGFRSYMRQRAERRRRHEHLQHVEKMEALGQLTGSVAHDFANVLGILATNIGLIRKLGSPDPRIRAAAERAQHALDNGTEMTKRLMAFGRRRALQVEECDLNAAVAAVLPLLQNAAGSRCRVVFEPAEGLPACRLDRSQLDTALINLVVNARHAIPGDGLVTIGSSKVAPDDFHLPAEVRTRRFVCLTVRDNGRGMPEEVRRRALEPFFTTKGEDGTGLGLAQVYSFVQQVGGIVAIESAVGAGTAVHLCFPAAAQTPGSQPGCRQAPASTAAQV